ncbi:hypothetical protein AB0K00_05645 [Dactylosporangium sp. NPDC049525]|uniref:hypothetical protein n=1 Tax=Dactylosporangium sp. NPDC049525 TaxID=3154730 RepID=UPI0034136680
MRRPSASWRIWATTVVSAATVDLVFAFRQLWLQPRADAGDLVRWLDLPLDLLASGVFALAAYLPLRMARRYAPPPPAFLVMPGRFVAPPAPWLRVVTTQVALATWGAVPVFLLSWQLVAPDSTLRVPGTFAVLASLLATVVAWRSWRRTVTLTPDALIVREVWDTEVELPWSRAASELVADPRSLRWIDARFLARAVDHYWAEPAHRAAIGTPEEHQRLTALLASSDLAAPAAPSTPDR